MTKTLARQLASRQLSYGHFRPSGGCAWVNCPECRQSLTVEFPAWQKPASFLRAALVSHLVEDH